jgi:hypothetical protein
MGHALLSPSSASQWLTCTVAPRLCEGREDSSSEFADEGTLAHAYAETYLDHAFRPKSELTAALEKLKSHKFAKHYSEELEAHASDFADYVLEQCVGDFALEIEQKLDLRKWVPEGFGTGDAIVVKDGILNLNDLKFGRGVRVSSVENKQLMIYGLGCIEKYTWLYDFHTIRLHIYQPRIGNISVWSITVDELLKWAEDELMPKAKLAYEGKGEAVPGDHCRFCKVKAECRAFAEMSMGFLAEEFSDPKLLSIEEIAGIIPKLPLLEMFVKAVHDFSYARLLSGESIPGFKLVKGKPSRVYTDPAAIKQKLIEAGWDEEKIITPPKERTLLALTALEKVLKKKPFTELVGPYITVKHASPAMAPDTDKREEYKPLENDFAEELLDDNWDK